MAQSSPVQVYSPNDTQAKYTEQSATNVPLRSMAQSSPVQVYSPNGTQAKYTEQSATNVPLRSIGTQARLALSSVLHGSPKISFHDNPIV